MAWAFSNNIPVYPIFDLRKGDYDASQKHISYRREIALDHRVTQSNVVAWKSFQVKDPCISFKIYKHYLGSCLNTIKKDLSLLILGPGIHKNVKLCSTRTQ